MRATIEYVYCIVPDSFETSSPPLGIDGSELHLIARTGLAAVSSSLDAGQYSATATAGRAEDLDWLTPRAVIHDSVVTWASDSGAVLPLPMWVMFADREGVTGMLDSRAPELRETLALVSGAREFGVRVSADAPALQVAARSLDPALADIERQMSDATPGQAYLLGRKLAEARRNATRNVASRIAQESHDVLSRNARSSVARASRLAEEPGVILDGAYLVPDDRYDDFREAVTGLVARYGDAGCRFDFTGPWPPYHFARAS